MVRPRRPADGAHLGRAGRRRRGRRAGRAGPEARDGVELAGLALGRIATQRGTIDRWLAEAAARADADPGASLRTLSVHARDAVAQAARALVDEAERGAGARPFVTGGDLDRAARDLRVFLLQHRLDPLVARAGREAAG